MIKNLSISNFRGFHEFRMRDLGTVNLLVGTNNCGKSTVLESIELASSYGSMKPLWAMMFRRGEHVVFEDERKRETEVAISHLFHGHGFDLDSTIDILVDENGHRDGVKLEIRPQQVQDDATDETYVDETSSSSSEEYVGPFDLNIRWQSQGRVTEQAASLTNKGSLTKGSMHRYMRMSTAGEKPVRYITTAAMTVDDVLSLFDEIVLTPEEDILLEALRTIDDSIERIASISSDRHRLYGYGFRGAIVVKCRGTAQRIPIGTMGDGMWRMLGLAIALSTAENGILLVDEIDTGLHYSVMADMWRLVKNTAERLNVQVFATTHSRDCYESLAAISRESVSDGSQVTIQRIERERNEAVAFTEREIVIAASRELEVR